jgi:hypothetical protein
MYQRIQAVALLWLSVSTARIYTEESIPAPAPQADAFAKLPSESSTTWNQDFLDWTKTLYKVISTDAPFVSAVPESAIHLKEGPGIVFLSVSDGRTAAAVGMGSAETIAEAMNVALAAVRKAMKSEPGDRFWLKVDVAVSAREIDLAAKAVTLKPVLEGLAIGSVSFLPEQVSILGMADYKGRLQPDRLAEILKEKGIATPPEKAHAFKTVSYFRGPGDAYFLYRSHPLLPAPAKEQIENFSKSLTHAATLAGEYLIRVTNKDGSFDYRYYPGKDRNSGSYNLLRHAGTCYSMFELYQVTWNRDLLSKAERAMKYLPQFVKPFGKSNSGTLCLVDENGEVKLGLAGLAVIAYVEQMRATGQKKQLQMAQALARFIKASQLSSGKFISKRTYSTGKVSDFESRYYPGEAILALVRLYSIDRDPTWLDVAEKAAKYLITQSETEEHTTNLIHDHWLLYGLNELYRHRPDSMYMKRAFRTAQSMSARQVRQSEYPDHLGGFPNPPRITSTATRSEGLVATWHLATDFGYHKEANHILNTLVKATAYQLRGQYGPESAMYFRRPYKALGGFRNSITGYSIQIDYVQHNLSALLGLHRILTRKER